MLGQLDDVYALGAAIESLPDNTRLDIDLAIGAAIAQINELRAALASLRDEAVSVELDLDTGGLMAELAAIRAILESINENIQLRVDVDGTAEIAALRTELAALPRRTEVNVDVDTDNIRYSTSLLRNIINSLISGVRLALNSVSALGQGISAIFSGLVGLLRGVSGSLSTIASGFASIASAAAGLAGIVLTVGLITGALSGLAGIIVSIGALLGGLIGIAASFGTVLAGGAALAAGAIAEMVLRAQRGDQAFQGLRDSVSELQDSFHTSFAGAALAMQPVATQAIDLATQIMPQLGAEAEQVANAIGSAFDRIGQTFQGSGAATSFMRILDSMDIVMEDIVTAAGNLGIALAGVFAAALPQVQQFAQHLADVTEEFAKWANSKEGQERLTQFFKDVGEAAQDVWDGLKNIGDAFSDLADVDSVRDFGHQFKTAADGVAAFLREVDKIEDAFSKAGTALDDLMKGSSNLGKRMGDSIGTTDIGPAVQDFIDEIVTEMKAGNWDAVGQTIGDRLREQVQKASNEPTLADSLANGIGALPGEIAKALRSGNWSEVGSTIGEQLREQIQRASSEGSFVDGIRNAIDRALDGAIQAVVQFGARLSQSLTLAFVAAVASAAQFGSQLRERISQGLTTAVSAVSQFGSQLRQRLTLAFVGAVAAAAQFGSQLRERISQGLQTALSAIAQFGGQLRQRLTQAFTQAVQAALQFGQQLRERITQGLQTALQAVQQFGSELRTRLSQAFQQAVSAVQQFGQQVTQGIQQAFQQAVEAVSQAMQQIVEAITQGFQSAVEAATQAAQQIVEAITQGFQQAVEAVSSAIQAMVSAIQSGMQAATSAVQAAVQAMVGVLQSAVGQFASIGSQIIQALISAIQAGQSAVVAAIVSMVQAAVNAAKGALGISSPSRVFLYFGQMLMEGLRQGIEQHGEQAVTAAHNVATRIQDVFSSVMADVRQDLAGAGIGWDPRTGAVSASGVARGASDRNSENARQTARVADEVGRLREDNARHQKRQHDDNRQVQRLLKEIDFDPDALAALSHLMKHIQDANIAGNSATGRALAKGIGRGADLDYLTSPRTAG